MTNEPNSSGPVGASQAPESSPTSSTSSAGASTPAAATTPKAGIPAFGKTASPAAQTAAVAGAEGAPVVPPSYQPNYKFKAFREEKEIDELFRGIIKDSDTEKKVKELHERAYALDPMKSERDEWKNKYSETSTKFQQLDRSVAQLSKFVENNDWTNFFSALKVPEDQIFNWVSQRLEYAGLPPEKRAEVDRRNQLQMDSYTKESRIQEYEQRVQQQETKLREVQFDTLLNRSDISQTATKWDAQAGQQGAFRQLVIEEAAKHFAITSQMNPQGMGEDLSPDQAVQLVMKKFGRFISAGDTAAAQAPSGQMSSVAQPGAGTPPPIIPHVPGRTTSPVKKQVRSIQDLKDIANQLP